MCLLMASGEAAPDASLGLDHAAYPALSGAITHVAQELAKMIVRDGEGATKIVEVTVAGAHSDKDAHAAAMQIADSPLVKTALFGNDPNWGRIVMALGNSGAEIDPAAVDVTIAGAVTCQGGMAVEFDREAASAALAEPEVAVEVALNLGDHEATVWTCDFSYDYVRINAEYTT
jgi:glutamate N-acetyltransferase/amino-acid N-acetyltransferase